VHGPFIPAPRHRDLYVNEPIPYRRNVKDDLTGKPVLRRAQEIRRKQQKGEAQVDGTEGIVRNQLRALMAVDEGLGEILKTLEVQDQLDNTLVLFTSDNGYFWGEHGLRDKRFAYEESIRIPLLMRYPPAIRPGSRFSEIVLNIDIAPTVLELAGVPSRQRLHGLSLVPVLRGTAKRWRRSFLAEYFLEDRYPHVPSWQAVRTEQWKYIHYTELEDMDELYDLQADPYEMKNLIAEPSARQTRGQLQKELQRLVRETEA